MTADLYCKDMKLSTLENVLAALENEKPQITVPAEIATPARKAIETMIKITES